MQYNPLYDVALSSDKAGMIEYWSGQASGFKFPEKQLNFEYKTDTDLFEFVMVSVYSCIHLVLPIISYALKRLF